MNLNNGVTKEMKVLNDLNFDYLNEITSKLKVDLKYANILDIGIGGGYLANKVVKQFPKAKYVGLDIENNLVKPIKKDIRVFTLDLNHLPDLQKVIKRKTKYDLILIFDVLEHLIHFRFLLQNLHQMLTKNGLLVVSIPVDINLSARVKLLIRDNIFTNPFHSLYGHINLFSLNSLETGLTQIKTLRIIDSHRCGLGYGLYDRKYHLDLLAKYIPSLSSRIYYTFQKS